MTAGAGTAASELLAELRRLHARLPVPQPAWHPYVPLIAAARDDLERALALAAERPDSLELAAALLDGGPEPAFDEDASPELTAAWRRLEALPLPDGRHPYLDDILPVVEGLRLLLVALSRTGGG